MSRPEPRYQPAGIALLRARTDPGGPDHLLDLPHDLDPDRDPAQVVTWLTTVTGHPRVRAALETASPALLAAIGSLTVKGVLDDDAKVRAHRVRQVRRAMESVASYLLRWQRPTPFGLFAGVVPVRTGPAHVAWGGRDRVAVRPDALWLADILTRLQTDPALRERLPIVTNPAATARGGRLVAPGPAPLHKGASMHDELAPVEISVRHSRPVASALRLAHRPLPYSRLAGLLAQQLPAASSAQIHRLLDGLLDQDLLLCALWAPMTSPDPLALACDLLRDLDAAALPGIGDLVAELLALENDLPGLRTVDQASLPEITARMRALSTAADPPIALDLLLDGDIAIPAPVLREAADAAALLCRLSPSPHGTTAWRDYHARFRDRYGTGNPIPVLEVLADSGLGYPPGYLGADRDRPLRQLTARDETILALVQNATLEGTGEIVLTPHLIATLTGPQTIAPSCPERVEIAVEIHAGSPADLDRGRFTLHITGTPRAGSSMAGRHTHLLSHDQRERFTATYPAGPGTVSAQVSFPPRRRRNANITRTGPLLPQTISLGEYRDPDDPGLIPVDDLAVVASEDGFALIRRSTGQHVDAYAGHALEATVHTPPLARFLTEITTARRALYKSFDYGAASRLLYLPAVRYRRTLLAPARWILTATDLPNATAGQDAWDQALLAWRDRWRMPAHIAVLQADQRQPLDLDHPAHRLLLRSRLRRAGQLELRASAPPGAFGWIGHPHELLLPLLLVPGPAAPPATAPRPSRAVPEPASGLPGQARIVSARLSAHPDRWDDLLIDHLPGLFADAEPWGFDEPPPWWFRRRRPRRRPDAAPHLELHLALPDPDAYGAAVAALGSWAEHLRAQGLLAELTLATYTPHPGRYGHGPALEAAHQVFAADSAAALAQLTATRTGLPTAALAAASMIDLATAFAPDDGLHRLLAELPHTSSPLPPHARGQALALTDPSRTWKTLAAHPAGTAIISAWEQRATTLAAYRKHLHDQRDPDTVLGPLLRLHANRASGGEARTAERLARACALRHTQDGR